MDCGQREHRLHPVDAYLNGRAAARSSSPSCPAEVTHTITSALNNLLSCAIVGRSPAAAPSHGTPSDTTHSRQVQARYVVTDCSLCLTLKRDVPGSSSTNLASMRRVRNCSHSSEFMNVSLFCISDRCFSSSNGADGARSVDSDWSCLQHQPVRPSLTTNGRRMGSGAASQLLDCKHSESVCAAFGGRHT